MAARRPVLAIIVVSSFALALAAPSPAASPQTIYRDLADNGKLDRRYSQADIARAFNLKRVMRSDATPPTTRRPAAVNPRRASEKSSGRTIPFSGLDLALLIAGGGPLLLIGLALRRRATPSPEAGIVGS